MSTAGPAPAPDRTRRIRLAAACALAAALGVASKRYGGAGRSVAIGQGEDFFGTLFLVLAPRLVLLHVALWKIAAAVLAILVAIELSQLLHGGFIERLRANWWGGHILGNTFEVADLFAYALGAAAAIAVDSMSRR